MLRHLGTPAGMTLVLAWVAFFALAAFAISGHVLGPALFGSEPPWWLVRTDV